jgi:hypothetical protein
VDVGIVGRHSYAEDVQEQVHQWIGNLEPEGWANQLKDEPALEITYERKWKWLKAEIGSDWGYDLIPHAGGSVGNVAIYANAGVQVAVVSEHISFWEPTGAPFCMTSSLTGTHLQRATAWKRNLLSPIFRRAWDSSFPI